LIEELASERPRLLPPLTTDCAAVAHSGLDRRLLTAENDPDRTRRGAGIL